MPTVNHNLQTPKMTGDGVNLSQFICQIYDYLVRKIDHFANSVVSGGQIRSQSERQTKIANCVVFAKKGSL
jgi:hypothetical protein